MNTSLRSLSYGVLIGACACACIFSVATIASADTSVDADVSASTSAPTPAKFLKSVVNRLNSLRGNNDAMGHESSDGSATSSHQFVPAIIRADANMSSSTREHLLMIASTTRVRFEDRIATLEQEMSDRKTKRDEQMAKIKATVSTTTYTFVNNLINRMVDAHTKLSDLLVSISKRAADAAAAGTDVSALDSAIADAQTSLSAALDAIDAAQTAVQTAVDATTPSSHISDIHTAIETASKALKDANTAVFKALSIARSTLSADASVHESTDASSTVDTTTSN